MNTSLTSNTSSDRHWNSMMASLSRRLEVARAANNVQLISLLEQERQQIAHAIASLHGDVLAPRPNWLQKFRATIAQPAKPQVHEFVNGSDRWWYAVDPQTGAWHYADSKAEVEAAITHGGTR